MVGLIIFVHITVCILLIALILIQRGQGGGLVESLSNLDSMFGAKTNTFLSRFTTVLATLFLISCLTLAIFSARQSRSLMRRAKPAEAQAPMETESAKQNQATGQSEQEGVVAEPKSQPQPEANKSE